jgi:prepilin-type N-terminal cleavage/methylation domain-containing protein
MRRTRTAQAGYTMVEVLAAMAVLGTGLLGIIAMQSTAVNANQRAQEITMATNLARRWQDRLRRDSYQWTAPSQTNPVSNLPGTWYLARLGTSVTTDWYVPDPPSAVVAGLTETAAFDYFGNDVPTLGANAYYCTQVRLTSLIPNQLIRAEVRIWWYRQGGVRPPTYGDCARSATVAVSSDTTNIRSVYVSQTIQRHDS